jgi:hypothetical protein
LYVTNGPVFEVEMIPPCLSAFNSNAISDNADRGLVGLTHEEPVFDLEMGAAYARGNAICRRPKMVSQTTRFCDTSADAVPRMKFYGSALPRRNQRPADRPDHNCRRHQCGVMESPFCHEGLGNILPASQAVSGME